jgi:hypothetical protein
MKSIINIGLAFVFASSALILAGAQTPTQTQPQSSLGDYARKVQKNPSAAKSKPKVYDNDNLPKDDKLSIVGQQSTANAGNAAPADTTEKASSPADAKATETKPAASGATPADDEQAKKQAAWKAWQEKLAAQKEAIDLASRELDVLQREYQLRAAALYADTGNRLRNSTEWDKQDADYKQKIADKLKALDDAKQKLADMQEEARKSGVPSSMLE